MELEWDDEKAHENLRKHGVDFADTAPVFDDPLGIAIEDEDADEERFIRVGADALNRTIVVVYAWRPSRIRIISARKATRQERKTYESKR